MAKERSLKKASPSGATPHAEPPEPHAEPPEPHAEPPEPHFGFETAVAEIEAIVRGLESGDWSLTESLEQYERAVGRLQTCHRMLESAQRRVTLLSGFDAEGNPVTESLDASEPGEASVGDPEALERKRRSRVASRGLSPKRGGETPERSPGPRDVSRDPAGEVRTDEDVSPGLF